MIGGPTGDGLQACNWAPARYEGSGRQGALASARKVLYADSLSILEFNLYVGGKAPAGKAYAPLAPLVSMHSESALSAFSALRTWH